jgi:hypothetical protein
LWTLAAVVAAVLWGSEVVVEGYSTSLITELYMLMVSLYTFECCLESGGGM